MHQRRLAAFLVGAWLTGSLFMALVALGNFRSVDRVLASPPKAAAQMIQSLGQDSARQLLRFLASEENRAYFRKWELAQFPLGLAALGALLFATERRALSLLLCALMLAVLVLQRFAITPEMVYLGRIIDFPPGNAASGERARFWTLHQVYSALEVLKLMLGAGLTTFLLLYRRRRRPIAGEVDAIDDSDHGRVDR